jgi:acyl-CoA synthetase (AMP-forming)/AMP-acid ligase II
MNWIARKLEEHLEKVPDHAFLYDEATPRGLTYRQFDDLSGRVAAYLERNGIGKEDFVLINLPRGVQPLIAIMGVWRRGAAFALVEDTYAPERIDFIRGNCSCKLEISAKNWKDVMDLAPLAGFVDAGDHDAAYAIYTSGTTGNPKGVLHEYGNLREAAESLRYRGGELTVPDERFALAAPLNFVASIMVFLKVFDLAQPKLYILSYATVKSPLKLGFFMLEKRISCTFLTPSYVRAIGSKTGPFLKRLFVGAEPANGIAPGKLDLNNCYAMSESGFAVGIFKIDRSYDTCPIGQPQFDKKVYLLDEEGKEVPDGEIGELCFDNPFVRGYIDLPEETGHAFRNGVYHSGDLAKKLPSGDYVLLGRNTDMVKINGNRVEPAEVEAAVKQVLGIDWCAVRGFEDDEQAFLAAYYTADIPKVDVTATRELLSRRLPYYMLPQYFIHIDQVPLKATGKLDRKALPKPDTSDYVSDYVAPRNETEQALCKAMAKALRIKRVGINDDFYELGGDSLKAMELIVLCGLRGLNASDVFRGRTPEKIAAIYLANHARNDNANFDELNEQAKQRPHRLTAEQNFMVDYQLYTPISTMYNLFAMIKIDPNVFEPERIAEAVNKVLRHHAVFGTVFGFDDDGVIVQSCRPELVEQVRVEKVSEFDLRHMRDDLVKPYKIIGSKLYRCRLFETEKALYLFFDVHHTIFDGTSFKVLVGNIINTYMGEEPEPDYYYLALHKREEAELTPFYAESKKFFEDNYGEGDWVCRLKTDHESRDNEVAAIECSVGVAPEELKLAERAFNLSRNEFFIAAFAIAFALHERAKNVKFSWIYNGREDVESMSSCGLFFRALPAAFRFTDDTDLRDICAATSKMVAEAIEHCCYPYLNMTLNAAEDDLPCLLYQSDIRDAGQDGMAFEQIDIRQNNAASQSIMDVEILDGRDGMKLAIHYTASLYEKSTMERFMTTFAKTIGVIAAHTDQSKLTFGDIRDAVLGKPGFFAKLFGGRK